MIRAAAPDLVLLQEAVDPVAVRAIGTAAGLPHAESAPRRSLAVLSAKPIASHAWHRPWPCQHAFLEVVLGDDELRVFGVHLSAIHSRWTERRRLMELRALLASIAAHQHGPHLVVGDFNTLAPGAELDVARLPPRLRPFVWLSGGRIRWQTVAMMLERGYVDVFRLRHPEQPGFTFPSWDPHLRLDYAFASAAIAARIGDCGIVTADGTRAASDHLPIGIELRGTGVFSTDSADSGTGVG